MPRLLPHVTAAVVFLAIASRASAVPIDQTDMSIEYRLEKLADLKGFGGPEIALLEKINRADAKHLTRLPQVMVPNSWRTELEHSPFPTAYPAAQSTPKLIVVDQPTQSFAAYENGVQVGGYRDTIEIDPSDKKRTTTKHEVWNKDTGKYEVPPKK